MKPFDLNATTLSSQPCSLQLVLLPYGVRKESRGDVERWRGGLDDAKALQAWILKAVSVRREPGAVWIWLPHSLADCLSE